jgi:VanZ family protein
VTLIFAVSSIPNLGTPPLFRFSDKVPHFIEYAVLGYLLYRAFSNRLTGARTREVLRTALVVSLLWGLALGLVDEFHQLLIPGRSCDPLDFLADAAGLSLTASLAYRIVRRRTLVDVGTKL